MDSVMHRAKICSLLFEGIFIITANSFTNAEISSWKSYEVSYYYPLFSSYNIWVKSICSFFRKFYYCELWEWKTSPHPLPPFFLYK